MPPQARRGLDGGRSGGGHASQQLTDRPDGTLRVTMTLNNLEEVERWVLSFGEHGTVVKPQDLRERAGKIGRELAKKYGT